MCARLLEYFFSYQNTFLHRPPHFDLMNIDKVSFAPFDFVLCSDVLEHVPPPVDKAMRNLRRLVKPGGALILTVPYLEGDETYMRHSWSCEMCGYQFESTIYFPALELVMDLEAA